MTAVSGARVAIENPADDSITVVHDSNEVLSEQRPASAHRARSAGRWLRQAATHTLVNWWAVIGLFVAWHLWVTIAGYNRIVVPTPLEVLQDLVTNPGVYVGDALRTMSMATFGLVVGMIVGFLAAVAIWWSPLLGGVVSPIALVMRSIPIVAVIPVVARLVGYGNQLVPIVTVLLAFFPAFVMTGSGLRSATPTALDVMHAFGATRGAVLRKVLIPSSVRALLVAFRMLAPSAILVAMIAEFLAGTSGLGRLFATARTRYDTPRAWGAALLATAISVALFQLALRVERWGNDRLS